jgi:Fe-S-cluster containining protein
LSASASEIASWDAYRPDIHRYVSEGNIWMDPGSGDQLTRCPWLNKLPGQNRYICGIYHDRPDDCRYYPVTIDEMIKDGCEMLEAKDLANPKHAQKVLDRLMADSRSPFVL